MWTGNYNPTDDEVWIHVRVFGPNGDRYLNFILDSGTPITMLHTGVADTLGYGAHLAKRRSRLRGVGGWDLGYVIDVQRFEAMGQVVEPFEVACHDTPEDLGVEGLIGMNFFRGRILTLDGIAGKVILGP